MTNEYFNQWMNQTNNKLNWIIHALKENLTMSDALKAKLAEIGAEEQQVITILQTDSATITTLQNALDAAKADEDPDEADELAEAQTLLDNLKAVIPAAPVVSGDTSGTANTSGGASGAASGDTANTGATANTSANQTQTSPGS